MQEGEMRVWWIPQIPGKPFHVPVESIREAQRLLSTLARYDAFQLANNIKPDYCNVGGLEWVEDGQWCEWYSQNGESIDELAKQS